MDQIEINGLRVMARHGYTKEEKMMEHTVECGELIKLITQTLKEEPYQLIEKAAQRLIEVIFDYSPIICGVELALKKTQSGILADFDSIGVRLVRARSDFSD